MLFQVEVIFVTSEIRQYLLVFSEQIKLDLSIKEDSFPISQ